MAYNKPIIWVGSDNNNQNGVTKNGLKLMRQCKTGEINLDAEFCTVIYEEWYEGEDGTKYNSVYKKYIAKDIPARPQELNDDGEVTYVGHPEYLIFKKWYDNLIAPILIPAISGTLKAIPEGCKNEYIIHPDNIDL